MKAQVYKDPRPAEYFDRFHKRARESDPWLMYNICRAILAPYCLIVYRLSCRGRKNVPAEGPAILAPNHFSTLDHFVLGTYLLRIVRFMAKSQLFFRPLQFILTHGGAFPVRRGQRDEEAFITARALLGRGKLVAMYFEAGRSRSGKIGKARRGIGRLALETGVPVIPIAIFGTQHARDWKRLRFRKVYIVFGEQVCFDQELGPPPGRQQEVADQIQAKAKALYAEIESEKGTR